MLRNLGAKEKNNHEKNQLNSEIFTFKIYFLEKGVCGINFLTKLISLKLKSNIKIEF